MSEAREKDPKYGHIVGEFKCAVEDCKGHRNSWGPGLHRISIGHASSKQKSRRLKRERAEERRVEKAKIRRTTRTRRTKVEKRCPVTGIAHDENELGLEEKAKKYHYHKGRRGRCSCEKGQTNDT